MPEISVAAGWLQERLENLYKKDPGYSDKAASLFTLDLQSPQELPDNLRGEQWNFVQLPLSALQEELKQVKQVTLVMLWGILFDNTMAISGWNHYPVNEHTWNKHRFDLCKVPSCKNCTQAVCYLHNDSAGLHLAIPKLSA